MSACGSTTASTITPSQGCCTRMKATTLISVPICTSGMAMAEPAKAPTISASAESMVTMVPRLGRSAVPAAVSAT